MKDLYVDKIIETTLLDLSMISGSRGGKKKISDVYNKMKPGDVWKIRFMGSKFDATPLVNLMYDYGLDVFHIQEGTLINFYICRIDDYRIDNSVVRNVWGKKC